MGAITFQKLVNEGEIEMTHKEAIELELEKLTWLRNNYAEKYPHDWPRWSKRYWEKSDDEYIYFYNSKKIRNGIFPCELYWLKNNDCNKACPYEVDYMCLARGYTSSQYSETHYNRKDELEKCYLIVRDAERKSNAN